LTPKEFSLTKEKLESTIKDLAIKLPNSVVNQLKSIAELFELNLENAVATKLSNKTFSTLPFSMVPQNCTDIVVNWIKTISDEDIDDFFKFLFTTLFQLTVEKKISQLLEMESDIVFKPF